LAAERSVLIVDSSEETREVLRTALEQRGVRMLWASRAAQGLLLAQRHRPDVIVFDVESDHQSPPRQAGSLVDEAQAQATPLVLLGKIRRDQPLPAGDVVPKPYHYGPLIRKIEVLLAGVRQPLAGSAAG
jgi:DNA-binding response OmpR family regulator